MEEQVQSRRRNWGLKWDDHTSMVKKRLSPRRRAVAGTSRACDLGHSDTH